MLTLSKPISAGQAQAYHKSEFAALLVVSSTIPSTSVSYLLVFH